MRKVSRACDPILLHPDINYGDNHRNERQEERPDQFDNAHGGIVGADI
jgi:hypothetical protein